MKHNDFEIVHEETWDPKIAPPGVPGVTLEDLMKPEHKGKFVAYDGDGVIASDTTLARLKTAVESLKGEGYKYSWIGACR